MTISFKLPLLLSLFLVFANADYATAQTNEKEVELNIFPNPSRGEFYITLVNEPSSPAKLYAMDGRMVKNMQLRNGANYVSLNVPAGAYMLKVGREEEQDEFKVMIK